MLQPLVARGEKCIYEIDTDATAQTIDCFGASDAWSMWSVGEMPQETRDREPLEVQYRCWQRGTRRQQHDKPRHTHRVLPLSRRHI